MGLRDENIALISNYLENSLKYFVAPAIGEINNKNHSQTYKDLIREIDSNVRNLNNFISLNYKYISTSNLNNLTEVLSKLTSILHNIKVSPPQDGKNSSIYQQAKSYIKYILDDLVSEYEYDFSHTYTPDEINDLIKILDLFCKEYEINFPALITEYGREINDKNTTLDLNDLANIIIKSINYIIDKRLHSAKTNIHEIFNIIKTIKLEQEENKLHLKAEKINETTEQTVRQLNLSQNIGLITLFNEEANKYEKRIQLYSYAIVFLFCVIACSILLKLLLSSQYFELNRSIVFIALITSLSAFLAYFIKERSRLYNLETYCRKNYLELSALSPYMAELTDEQRQALRIGLSEKYFKGHENIETNAESTSQISMFSEIIKTLNELKSKN